MAGLTGTTLISSIRRRASIPSTAVTGSADADLLAYATEEMQLHMTAELMEVREEYFARDSDSTIGSSTSFRIPDRAIGGKLRDVQLLDSAGAVILTLTRTEPERLEDYDTQPLYAFTVKGQNILLPQGSTTTATSIRLGYYARPNELTITAADWATVLSVSGNVITTTAAHGFTTSSSLDLVKSTPGFEHQFLSSVPTATTSTTLTFASLSGLSIVANDYVCVAEKSPVPQIPAELHPLLAQRVAVKYLEAEGDRDGLTVAQRKLEEMEEAASTLISPRVDGAVQKIVNRHGAVGGVIWRRRLGVG